MNQPGFCRKSFRGFEHCSNGFGIRGISFSVGFFRFFLHPETPITSMRGSIQTYGCFQKDRGKTPKMDGENNGNPIKMDDLRGKPTIFGNIHILNYYGNTRDTGKILSWGMEGIVWPRIYLFVVDHWLLILLTFTHMFIICSLLLAPTFARSVSLKRPGLQQFKICFPWKFWSPSCESMMGRDPQSDDFRRKLCFPDLTRNKLTSVQDIRKSVSSIGILGSIQIVCSIHGNRIGNRNTKNRCNRGNFFFVTLGWETRTPWLPKISSGAWFKVHIERQNMSTMLNLKVICITCINL